MKTIEEAIEAYLEHAEIMHFTPSTIKGLGERYKRFLDWCEVRSLTQLDEVTKEMLYAYQKHLNRFRKPDSEPLSINTQQVYMSTVKVLFSWLLKYEYIEKSPAMYIELPKRPKKVLKRGLSHSEMDRLLKTPDTTTVFGIRNRCLLEVLYCTAARSSEVANMKIDDIDYERKLIFINQGKGRKDGVAFLGESAIYWLRKYIKDSRPRLIKPVSPQNIFITSRSKAFTSGGLGNKVKRIMLEAGIDKYGAAHLLRHSFAVHMLEKGMDSRYITEFLRHESMETTQNYLGLDLKMLREQFDSKFEG